MSGSVAKIIFCLVLFAALALTGMAQTPKPDAGLKGKYRAIEVTRFEVEKDVDIPGNQVNVLMLEIVDELYKLKKFDQIIKPTSQVSVQSGTPAQPTIRLVGTFTKYSALIPQKDSVDRGEIWTHIRVQVKFVDAADNSLLLEKEIDRRIFFGTYQFYLRDVTRKVAKEVAKITHKNFF